METVKYRLFSYHSLLSISYFPDFSNLSEAELMQ